MRIAEALRDGNHNLRVTCGHRWLCGDKSETGRLTVYERKAYARFTTVILETYNEGLAVKALLGDDL